MTDLTPYLDEARARGLQWAVNDARSWARASVDRLASDGVSLSSFQSWASILVLVEAVEAGKLSEPLPALSGAAALVPPEDVLITSAADFAAWWNAQPDERRWEAFSRIREWSESSVRCVMENHRADLARAADEIRSLKDQLELANVSRETSRHLDPLKLQLGQLVDVYAWPIHDGAAPVAHGTFVAIADSENGDGAPVAVIEERFENDPHHQSRLSIDRHEFVLAKAGL